MNAPDSLMLQLDAVSLSYKAGRGHFEDGTHHVLRDVSLSVHAGETLGVIGRNGSGKSTILRLMAGIFAPTAGRVMVKPRATVALLSLGLGFKPNLSGRDNALLSAMLQGVSRADAVAGLNAIRDFSELGDSFDEPVRTYSAGMRARLGFTTALLTQVDILLIDEVLSVGDASFRDKAQQALQQRISGEQTVVFVSHTDAQVRSICDRAIWIDDASIRAEGETAEVLRAYRQALKSPKA